MKKTVTNVVIILFILGCSSMVHAYSYAFDIQSGGVLLNADDTSGFLSIVTTDDLLVAFDFDPPPDDALLEYSLSMDMTFGFFGGFVNYDLVLENIALGVFQGIDPTDWIGDGTSVMVYDDTALVSGQFGDYALVDATLAYDVMFAPPPLGSDAYAITIAALSLSGGNTQDLLTGIIDDLNQSGELPIILGLPIVDLPVMLSGEAELTANPVPIPAAVWLFGSGLFGILGIRRRFSK